MDQARGRRGRGCLRPGFVGTPRAQERRRGIPGTRVVASSPRFDPTTGPLPFYAARRPKLLGRRASNRGRPGVASTADGIHACRASAGRGETALRSAIVGAARLAGGDGFRRRRPGGRRGMRRPPRAPRFSSSLRAPRLGSLLRPWLATSTASIAPHQLRTGPTTTSSTRRSAPVTWLVSRPLGVLQLTPNFLGNHVPSWFDEDSEAPHPRSVPSGAASCVPRADVGQRKKM